MLSALNGVLLPGPLGSQTVYFHPTKPHALPASQGFAASLHAVVAAPKSPLPVRIPTLDFSYKVNRS